MFAWTNLIAGFSAAMSPENLMWAFLGAMLGTFVGVLPGVGPTPAIAMLLPLTSYLPPTPAIIMLAGIYYGSQYGGSTTSILLNMPGEISSVPTCLDGYQLAKKGRAGPALAMAALGSFFAGTLSLVGLTFFAPPLADLALMFTPAEYVGLMVLALAVVVNLSGRSLTKGLISAGFGLLFTAVGMDSITGVQRLNFGNLELMNGVNFVVAAIGLFAIAEILIGIEEEVGQVAVMKIGRLMPTLRELMDNLGAMVRATLLGFFLGLLPGVSPGVTAFIAYDTEKRFSKHPELFGTGVLEGVTAPEGANNATTSGGFVPLFAFGLPSSSALAMLLGALMIYGLQPGPIMWQQDPQFVWTVIASMYIGNVMLLVLNLPLVGVWAKVCEIPYSILAPAVLIFCVVGAFSVRGNVFDLWMALVFGFVGYAMKKLDYPPAPMLLCMILGDRLESSMRQALVLSSGSFSVFFTRPITVALLTLAVLLTVASLVARRRTSS
ncbi:MAG: tripartite tricarboxylate transporter permease, partial [Chloroflexota bacterium]